MSTLRRVGIPALAASLVLALLTACGSDDATKPVKKPPVIASGRNIAKVKAAQTVNIPIVVVDDAGATIPFTATTGSSCATVVPTSTGISVTGVTANCAQDVTISADGAETKTISLNVYDPLVMDIGEGLLISYVNQYSWRWNDGGSGGSNDATFWHPVVPAGWYALGSTIMGNYTDINATKDQPTVIVKDVSAAQNLLAAPTGYTWIWDDGGSGADNDGSVWKPTCPAGYVSLGSVVQAGYGQPSLNDVRCVATRFTTAGTVGTWIYNDAGTGANNDIAVYRVGPSVIGASPDGRYAMWTRTTVGCPGWDAILNCDLSTFKLLLIPMPVMENADDAALEPKLTGFTPFVPIGPRFFAAVRVPFTLIPTEDPLCGNEACATAASRVDNNIKNSPFYYLERQETYTQLGNAIDNRQGTAPVALGPFTYTNAFDETNASSFSQEIGMTISVEGEASFLGTGGKYSVELSTKLAWSQSHSTTFSQSASSSFGPFEVRPGSFAEVLQVTTQFRGRSEQGVVTGTAFGAGQNTAKFLRYPLN